MSKWRASKIDYAKEFKRRGFIGLNVLAVIKSNWLLHVSILVDPIFEYILPKLPHGAKTVYASISWLID